MATSFLFINEDQLSYVHRPRGVPSLVRGHARKYRGTRTDRHARREHCFPSARIICPKEPGTSVPKNQTISTSDHPEEAESGPDVFANLHYTLDIVPSQNLHYRILQLNDETQRLINFYLLWNISQAHSRLPCALSWPKTIVTNAFNTELHSLVLPCYIASMVSYLSQKLARPQRRTSRSNSQSIASEFYFDSDSPQSSRSPASPPPSVMAQTAEPPHFSFLPSSYPWNVSEISQTSHITRPSSARAFPTNRPTKKSSLTPALQHDLALSRSLSHPSYSDHDTNLPIPSDLAQLTHLALEALQSRISGKNKSSFSSSLSSDLLFPVWCLFRAAVFQSDKFAAVSHQRFLRHLVYRPDGSKCSSSWLVNVIVEVDLNLRLNRREIDECDKGSSALLVMSELRERMAEGP
ncbi:hypothetical protein N431DRAFT_442933 [Stipitochalara longipes BDJ]|nr:hypothetical protein N431DRAFT_442933 [Stipitochalara longipes BDJ]